MIKKIFALAALLALAAAPLALAHDGHNNGKSKTIPGPNPHCWPTQNPHDYGVGDGSRSQTFFKDGDAGAATVNDYNIEDCDTHDPTKQGPAHSGDADFDGDYEYGTGGGFFPAGSWANEPICQYGYVSHHHLDIHVHDAVWAPGTPLHDSVSFWVGADPSPPTVVTTPPVVIDPDGVPDSGDEIVIDEGGNSCINDGCICQGPLDPDDWLKSCFHQCPIFPAPPGKEDNPSYGEPGGDGGYWVFVNCRVETDGELIVDKNGDTIPDNGQDKDGDGDPDNLPEPSFEDKDGDTIPDNVNPGFQPPSRVDATCSATGHIYFPNLWP